MGILHLIFPKHINCFKGFNLESFSRLYEEAGKKLIIIQHALTACGQIISYTFCFVVVYWQIIKVFLIYMN